MIRILVAEVISTLKSIIYTLRINNSKGDAYSIIPLKYGLFWPLFSVLIKPVCVCVSVFFYYSRKSVSFEFLIQITMSLKCLSGREEEKQHGNRRA